MEIAQRAVRVCPQNVIRLRGTSAVSFSTPGPNGKISETRAWNSCCQHISAQESRQAAEQWSCLPQLTADKLGLGGAETKAIQSGPGQVFSFVCRCCLLHRKICTNITKLINNNNNDDREAATTAAAAEVATATTIAARKCPPSCNTFCLLNVFYFFGFLFFFFFVPQRWIMCIALHNLWVTWQLGSTRNYVWHLLG